jgi:hypothetical protein
MHGDSILKSVSIRNIRQLRQTADFLADNADQLRIVLVEELGLKRYVFNALGSVAHQPAAGSRLVWSDSVEIVDGADVSLGEFVFVRSQEEHDLPQAILTGDGRKYYL